MLKSHLDQTLPLTPVRSKPLHAVPIHDLNDDPELQHRHTIVLILHQAHVDFDELLPVCDASPAYGGKLRDRGGAKVGKEASAAKDASCRHAILGCAEAGVESWPGFEDEGGDVALGEEEGEEKGEEEGEEEGEEKT